MSTRNLTLALPTDLIRRAKVYAAAHDTSISALVAELLGSRVAIETSYDEAWAAEVEVMKGGIYHAGEIDWTRDDLHERKD